MQKARSLIIFALAVILLVHSSVFTFVQAQEEELSSQDTESNNTKGLIFDPAKQNSVQLNEVVDHIPSTFEMMVKFAKDPNHRQILFGNYRGGASSQFSLELTADNQFRYYEYANSKLIDKRTSGQQITTGEWTHLAVTRDVANKKVTVIQDGEVIATFENLELAEDVPLVNLHSIGTDTRNQYHIRAQVSEVRLWNDVRTLDEIKEHANTEISGDEEDLMHAWTLDPSALKGVINVIHDKAGKINATPHGFKRTYVSEFKGTGPNFADGELEIGLEERLSHAPRTVEAWVNVPADTPNNQRVGVILGNYDNVSYSDISRFNFEIYSNGNPRIYWNVNKDETISYVAENVNVNVGDWVHIAMVLDDADGKASTYINGEKVNEEVIPYPIPTDITYRELKIGSDYRRNNETGTPQMTFNGQIADVRVWSTVRTDKEIKANYNASLVGNVTGLIGNWKLDEEKNGLYRDSSKNKNDGLIYNEVTTNWLDPEFSKRDYTIAVLPDSQYLVESHPETFMQYTKWLKDHADDLNIKLAIHVGDLVNNPNSIAQWETVSKGMSDLNGVIPYVFSPGNHDEVLNREQLTRDTTNFNKYFPYNKYSQASTFGGAYAEGKMDNTYHYFNMNGIEYMVLALEFAPNDDVLAWANTIAAENPDKRIIVSTHSYMYHNGEQIAKNHIHYPSSYMADANNGDDMWNEFVSKHENIILVLSGHIGYHDLVVREDIGVHGNPVKQVLADAQYMQRDLGMVMLMTFKNGKSNKVDVNWYSVTKDKFYRTNNQFEMELNVYPKKNPQTN